MDFDNWLVEQTFATSFAIILLDVELQKHAEMQGLSGINIGIGFKFGYYGNYVVKKDVLLNPLMFLLRQLLLYNMQITFGQKKIL